MFLFLILLSLSFIMTTWYVLIYVILYFINSVADTKIRKFVHLYNHVFIIITHPHKFIYLYIIHIYIQLDE
jgi:hypothetical protein